MMDKLIEYDKEIRLWLHEVKDKINSGEIHIENVDIKADIRDLVTSVDKSVEKLLREKISARFPNDTIIGEESYNTKTKIISENVWIIDPIDATANFVKQKEDYAILISYFENEIPKLSYIYNVFRDELIYAIENIGVFKDGNKILKPNNISISESLVSIDIRKMQGTTIFEKVIKEAFDIRYIGCAGLDGGKVVTGQFGAYICPMLQPWDYSPLLLMAKELDLSISDFSGEPIKFCKRSDVIISTKQFLKDFIKR